MQQLESVSNSVLLQMQWLLFLWCFANVVVTNRVCDLVNALPAAGESVSSDTSIGYNNEVEIALIPWQASEDDPEVNASADVCVGADGPRWLQLSPSDTANLTGTALQGTCSVL